jgi:hypothetical protein
LRHFEDDLAALSGEEAFRLLKKGVGLLLWHRSHLLTFQRLFEALVGRPDVDAEELRAVQDSLDARIRADERD